MTGKIPQEVIDTVLARTDIVALIGTRVPLRRAGHHYVACCPFHNEKTPSFSVNPDRQFYYCFGCQAHGNALTFLLQHDHLDFLTALRQLAAEAGVDLPEPAQDAQSRLRQTLLQVLREANRYYQQQLRQHPQRQRAVRYLQSRGISGVSAAAFGLGYAPPGWQNLLEHFGPTRWTQLQEAGLISVQGQKHYDRLRDRITFPIHDSHGSVIGFGGRVLDDGTPKYLNSPETPVFHKGQTLYGLYQARRAGQRLERLLVVEGYLDVIALAQAGIPGVVATLGTALTAEQVRRLFQTTPELVFCFDGDRAGYQAAWKALAQVSPHLDAQRSARFLHLPAGEDPDTLVRQEGQTAFLARIESALPVPEFILNHLSAQHDPHQPEGQRQLLLALQPVIQQLPAGSLREVLLHHVGRRLGMERSSLLSALQLTARVQTTAVPQPAQVGMPALAELAIQFLLHRPELAQDTVLPEACLQAPGNDFTLLRALLAALQASPPPTLAGLLARWEQPPWGTMLAHWGSRPLPVTGTEQEWQDLLQRLAQHCAQQRMQQLAAKGLGALTPAERQELQRLTQGR